MSRGLMIGSAFCALIFSSFLARAEWQPGLLGGLVPGGFNLTDSPADPVAYLGPQSATNVAPGVWPEYHTWVYTGEIWLDGGTYFFAENIDDNVMLKISGETYIADGGGYDVFTTSSPVTLPAGWHPIEIRFGNGRSFGGPCERSTSLEGFRCGFGLCRGPQAPTSMSQCSYPSEPGDFSLFRYDDGMGFGDSLVVEVNPPFLGPETIPPIGRNRGISPGDALECSAPATFIQEGIHYRCLGFVRETKGDDGSYSPPVTNLGDNGYGYIHGETSSRLTWLYERDGVLLDLKVFAEGGGQIVVTPQPDLTGGCFTDGTVVHVTATPDEGKGFTWWTGDIADGAGGRPSISVTMDRPRQLQAFFHGAWFHDREAATISDGNWILSVVEGATPSHLSVASVQSVQRGTALDLRGPVVDGEGKGYSITSIGGFSGRNDLSFVFLPDSLVSLCDSAFQGCPALMNLLPFLGEAVEAVGRHALADCPLLDGYLVISNPALASIPANAFSGTGIRGADLPHVTVLQESVFEECKSLEVATCPRLERIGSACFKNDSALQAFTPFLPDTLLQLGESAFEGCEELGGDLVIRNPAIAKIESGTFFGAKSVTSVDIAQVREIGKTSFKAMDSLKTLRLSPALEKIDSHAFADCVALEFVVPFLPDTLISIADSVFSGCSSLRGDLVLSNPSLLSLPYGVFRWAAGITSVRIPHVESIGFGVFEGITSLGEVHFSPSLSSIGDNAFWNCSSVTNFSPFLPETLAHVGASAFRGCSKVKGPLYLANPALTNFKASSFRAMASLEKVYFPPTKVDLSENDIFNGAALGCAFYFPDKAPKAGFGYNVMGNDSKVRNIVYGSLRMDPEGWEAIRVPLNNSDRAAGDYPGPKTFGVFIDTYTKVRHWLVDYRSPLEPKGTILILR